MENRAAKIAEFLLKIKAIKLNPNSPFTWASGLKSPIYCDNRVTLSYPEVRKYICKAFSEIVKAEFPTANAVAGVATAGIAHGALLAEEMDLPFVYVRSSPKSHGLNNLIEGRLEKERNYVVIEDLVSTGGSSLNAAKAVVAEGASVVGLLSIFTYGFPVANEAFKNAQIPFRSLLDLDTLLQKATEINYIQPSEMDMIRKWKMDPKGWSESFETIK